MTRTTTTKFAAALLLLVLGSSALHAQTMVASDVKPGDWAYDAVQDLASKGLIQGYPPDGKFLGGRALTRYEMATIISRVLAQMDQLASSGANTSAMQAQIDETKKLTDDYKVELTVIGTNMTQAQADIAKLQGQVATLQQGLNSAYDAIEDQSKRTDALKKQVTNLSNTTYGSTSASKFNISGYIQTRFQAVDNSSSARFPQGTNAVQGPYNGNFAQGGTRDAAQVRRARLKVSGAPTDNTRYGVQIDVSGAVNAGSNAANQQVTVREAYGSYTFGNGDSQRNPTLTLGQFATPFGSVLPNSTSAMFTPERPLAFSEGTNIGLFDSQDYDKGLKATWGVGGILNPVVYTPPSASLKSGVNITYALINGSGRQAEGIDSNFDNLVHANIQEITSGINASIGASYYGGHVFRTRPATAVAATDTTTAVAGIPASQTTYPEPKKELFGLDAQVSLKNGIFADGEFVRGTYEKRSYFIDPTAVINAFTSTTLATDSYVKGNKVQGYYVWGGYTFNGAGSRPLTLGVDYDVFQRSINGQNDPSDALGSNIPTYGQIKTPKFYASGSSFDDVNIGYGGMYNLDKAMRLRLWYDHPYAVAHAPGTPDPPKIGLYTAELQVKF